MRVRPETPADYADIAAVNARAFGHRPNESIFVALLRHRCDFDPNLSLVAEEEGRVVGHAIFTPMTIRLLGQDVRAVMLGPIAVDPPYQKQGIGGALMEVGHAVARDKGYPLSFLVGHPSYYPRFGYRTRAFGLASITLREQPSAPPVELEARSLTDADVPALRALWRHEESAVDFSIEPGPDFMDWSVTNPLIEPVVYVRGSEVVGYARLDQCTPAQPKMFLARDHEAARAIAYHIHARAGRPGALTLPLHPRSASAAAFGAPETEPFEPAMAMSLAPNPFDEYYARVQAGAHPAGRVIYPPAFDLD